MFYMFYIIDLESLFLFVCIFILLIFSNYDIIDFFLIVWIIYNVVGYIIEVEVVNWYLMSLVFL